MNARVSMTALVGVGAWVAAAAAVLPTVQAADHGWPAPAAIEPERWRAAPQPRLESELASARELTLSNVLPGPTRVWTEGPFFAPNADGETWDAIMVYQNAYMGRKEIVVHDFGTGETHRQLINTGDGPTDLTRERFSLHIRPHFYANGKLFFDAGGPGLMVLVYDPASNAFVHGERPFGRDLASGAWALGEDDMLYGIGWSQEAGRRFVPFQIDTKTYEIKRGEPFGPPNDNRRELYSDAGMAGDWFYAAFGANPWHLVAYNFKTGEGRVLATTKDITGDHGTISMASLQGGLRGTLRDVAQVDGIDNFNSETFDFWLSDGQIHPREGDVPPWSDQPVGLRGQQYRWDSQVWYRGAHAYWGSFQAEPGPPEVEGKSMAPDGDGNVALRYRPHGGEWQTINYTVERYPGVTRHMTEIDEHRIFATDEGYGQAVIFDLQKGETQRIGDLEGLSTYSMTMGRDALYVSGYPSSRLWRFDVNQPFTLVAAQPTDAEANPREVAVIGRHNDVHMPLGTVQGADGRIYTAGTTTENRRRTGGGMGWYDTNTDESGGFWEAFSAHRVFWMTTADQGRYVLLSTKPTDDALNPGHTPDAGRIFCWDTQQGKLIYDVAVPGASVPGPLAEAMQGLVIGHAPAGNGRGTLYGFRADTGAMLWSKDVPTGPVTSLSESRRHAWEFRRGPDGNIWTFFGNTLVAIRPSDGRIAVIGKLPNDARASQLAFADGRVFIAGAYSLRVINGVRVEP